MTSMCSSNNFPSTIYQIKESCSDKKFEIDEFQQVVLGLKY